MSRHNAQLRAAQSAYDNQSPPEDDFCDETFREAAEAFAKADSLAGVDALEALAYAANDIRIAVGGARVHPLRTLLAEAEYAEQAIRNRYDALMAERGAP